jgi:hypothetical protein
MLRFLVKATVCLLFLAIGRANGHFLLFTKIRYRMSHRLHLALLIFHLRILIWISPCLYYRPAWRLLDRNCHKKARLTHQHVSMWRPVLPSRSGVVTTKDGASGTIIVIPFSILIFREKDWGISGCRKKRWYNKTFFYNHYIALNVPNSAGVISSLILTRCRIPW